MRLTAVLIALTLLCAACIPSSNDSGPATGAKSSEGSSVNANLDYGAYTKLLTTYVDDDGLVNYEELQKNRAPLDAFVTSFAQVQPATYETWSKETKIAFWINAYNAITLKAIIDNYPIKKGGLIKGIRYPDNSIRQIDGVWDKMTTRILNKDLTLDAIEHDILRKQFEEPRIHAALVCAAMSCPPLRREAFSAAKLEEQLTDQSIRFMSRDNSLRIDPDNKKVYLSEILDWFEDDFVGHYNTGDTIKGHGKKVNAALDYARAHTYATAAEYIANEKYDVAYIDYDWSLNEQK